MSQVYLKRRTASCPALFGRDRRFRGRPVKRRVRGEALDRRRVIDAPRRFGVAFAVTDLGRYRPGTTGGTATHSRHRGHVTAPLYRQHIHRPGRRLVYGRGATPGRRRRRGRTVRGAGGRVLFDRRIGAPIFRRRQRPGCTNFTSVVLPSNIMRVRLSFTSIV